MKKTIPIILLVAAAFIVGYLIPKTDELEGIKNDIKPEPLFAMSANLSCRILDSSKKDEIGRQISFINLNSDEPKILFGEGGTSPMKKIYETDDTLTIQLVASGSGSVDTFVIDKKTGLFSRVSVGSFIGIYATASKGNCK